MGNVKCWWNWGIDDTGFTFMPNNLTEKNLYIELERMSTKDTDLNEFIKKSKVDPRKIYRFFEEENLNDFINYVKEKWSKEGKNLSSFVFKEGKETNANEESNSRPGVLYKYIWILLFFY